MAVREDSNTISVREKDLENFQASKLPKFSRTLGLTGEVTTKKVSNFTCPACKEVLSEAISINGAVSGWCGNSHTFIAKKIE